MKSYLGIINIIKFHLINPAWKTYKMDLVQREIRRKRD